MAEQIIIAKTDIQTYWNVPNTVKDETVNIAILRAQQSDLKQVLGDPLYYAFIENYNGTTFPDANYQKLYDGGNYTYNSNTIYFSGVKQLLCAYAYIHLAKTNKINVVRSGVVVKSIEQAETAEDFQIRAITRDAYDQSQRIEGEISRYLYENRATYPLYTKRLTEDQKRTGFNFYTV
jgi:hypothetical protein